jgi:hypothetical protein
MNIFDDLAQKEILKLKRSMWVFKKSMWAFVAGFIISIYFALAGN